MKKVHNDDIPASTFCDIFIFWVKQVKKVVKKVKKEVMSRLDEMYKNPGKGRDEIL